MDSMPDQHSVSIIDFQDDDGGVAGEDRQGRRWRILEERSGWRLSFRDPGDTVATNAGVFGTLEAARHEADGAARR